MTSAAQDGQASSSDTQSVLSNNYTGNSVTGGAQDTAYLIQGFSSQGFNVTTQEATASDANPIEHMGYLALDLGSNPHVYSTSRTARTDTNDDVVDDVWFKPIFLIGIGGASATSLNTITSGGSFALGMSNGTHNYALSEWNADATTHTNTATRVTNTQFWSDNAPSSAIDYEADYT